MQRTRLKSFFVTAPFVLALLLLPVSVAMAEDFSLREELGRQWSNECVTFPLNAEQMAMVKNKAALVTADGTSVPWQLIATGSDQPMIAFQVDLAPFEQLSFRFDDSAKASEATDLKLEYDDKIVKVSNSQTGIELARNPKAGSGPIIGVKLRSGKWVGSSRLETDQPVTGWKVIGVERGPVLTELVWIATFGDKGTWKTRYRVYANEPVVLIEEEFSVDAKAKFELVLNDRFDADEIFFRKGNMTPKPGENLTEPIEPGQVFAMEPWLRWWNANRQGSTFSLFNRNESDMLTVAARYASVWVDPELPKEKRAWDRIITTLDDAGLHTSFTLAHGKRKWMIGAFDRDEALSVMGGEKPSYESPTPYRSLIKHGHFPLDLIKDYVLRWPSDLKYPRMILTPADVENFRARKRAPDAYAKTIKGFVDSGQIGGANKMDTVLPAYLATGDAGMGQALVDLTMEWLLLSVSVQLDQNGMPFGAAPHQQNSIVGSLSIADLIMDSPQITQDQRDHIKAMTAFLGYTVMRPDYWSPERRFSANANMDTTVYSFQARLGAFISDHPMAAKWNEHGMATSVDKLNAWSDENGGWLEAPHYAMLGYDDILGLLVIASNSGMNDWLYTNPKVKSVIRWMAKTASPPDSHARGFRHNLPIGNTYLNETSGEYGLLAYLFRDQDPEFSAEMQWMYQQQDETKDAGFGGAFPAFMGYREILVDPSLPAKAPAYTSELFPETAVVMRDHYPSDRETFLHLIQGRMHAHYDLDSGSIVFFGKGRLLANDFGYNGHAPQDQHNMVTGPVAHTGIMHVKEFSTDEGFDYFAGTKNGWTRQIGLIKGATPESPTYYLMNDSLVRLDQATWRLFLTAEEVQIKGNRATAIGKEDVDLDIFFLSPTDPQLTHKPKTITAYGVTPEEKFEKIAQTQIGLTSSLEKIDNWNVILYPRMKTEKPATFETLAGGKGAKVTHSEGTDYVFLSRDAFEFQDDKVQFNGRSGLAQFRGKEPHLVVGDEGSQLTVAGIAVTK